MSGSEIFLHIGSHCVAVLKPEHSDFSWSLTYTKDWKEKGFALSPTLPLEGNHSGEAVLAFIENLLPEGVALEHLSTLKSISKNNPIGLALAIKNDLAGAIRLSVNETTEPFENSQFRAISDQELIDRLRFPETNPMSVWDGKPRLSVAGMQTKLNVLKLGNQWGLADGSNYASDRLLKFESVEQKHLLLNEFLTMTLAREMGYNTAQVNMLYVGPYRTLEVIRFDRQIIGDSERIVKVARQHMIDACQALGLTSTKKYERHFGDGKDVAHIREGVSLAKLFSLTAFAKDPVAMKDELLNWLLFNLLVGNTDAHGKNFSFFVDQAGLTPTPWYDLLSVIQIPTVSHSLAMSIGDEFEYDNVHALQLLYEAEKINVPFDMLQERLQISIETMRSALLALPLTVELSKEEQAFVTRYKDSLFLRLDEWQAQCRLMPQLAQDSSLF